MKNVFLGLAIFVMGGFFGFELFKLLNRKDVAIQSAYSHLNRSSAEMMAASLEGSNRSEMLIGAARIDFQMAVDDLNLAYEKEWKPDVLIDECSKSDSVCNNDEKYIASAGKKIFRK